MTRAAAIGEAARVAGYALAGVEVRPAESAAEAREAWLALDREVSLLVLTPAARAALEQELAQRPDLVHAVLPG